MECCQFIKRQIVTRRKRLRCASDLLNIQFSIINRDGLVKSPKFVMPDLIRHPESTVITGFRLSPE